MQFSRPEYWSGLPCPSPRDLPNPGIEARCPAMQADSLPSEPPDVDIANSSVPQRKTTFSLLSLFLKTSFVSSIWQLSPSVFLALMLTANFLSIDVTQIPDLLLPNPHICSLKIKALNIFSTFFLHLRPFFSFLFFFYWRARILIWGWFHPLGDICLHLEIFMIVTAGEDLCLLLARVQECC